MFLEINKRGDPNKRGGWKFFQNLIKGVFQIKMSQVEKCSKINKRVTPYIRQVRVGILAESDQVILIIFDRKL